MILPENMIPLLDGDWLVYMCCNAIEYNWEEKAVEEGQDPSSPPPFDYVVTVFEKKVKDIKDVLQTETAPIIFFTGDNNFRKEVAKTKEYKGNRDSTKPYHFKNLTNYIEARYDTQKEDNLEADDLLAIFQTAAVGVVPTCIVTVDKDLRQVNGWHYSPEGYNYNSFGPRYCDDSNTYITPKDAAKISKGILGTGYKFFYAQLITGDTVDNIPGLPGVGPAKALTILEGCTTEGECFEAVRDAYRDICIMADDYLLEQAYLLWMVRDFDTDGKPVMWVQPEVGVCNG